MVQAKDVKSGSVNTEKSKGKAGFAHFMIKEIYEQPEAVRTVIEANLDRNGKLPQLGLSEELVRSFTKITIAASGSSRHAGMVGEFMLERMVGLDVEVDFASQYCYRDPVVAAHELTIFPSQSGTTIDTITALQVARRKGACSLAICNVPETPLTQLADATLLTHAGEEVAIAATKSFTTQLTALFLFSAHLAQVRSTMNHAADVALRALPSLPELIEKALETDKPSLEFARQLHRYKDFIYMGRDIDYPIALEGALKLKEVSYIHAEGYPTGELKHGPTALVNEHLPIVVLATQDRHDADSVLRYGKTVASIREFIDREIPVLAIVSETDNEVEKVAPCILRVPEAPVLLQPIIEVIPLQFLSYHIAVLCGRNIDRPRHLSKSVVIE
ncbi:MAG TPA: isomerizing glutamine--fructose-6-phosphate transaminase [Candidatus Angelobacter sp.]